MTVGQGLRLVIQALYFVEIARSLGTRNYGAFISVVALVGIVFPFGSLGSGNLLVKNVCTKQKPIPFLLGPGAGVYAVHWLSSSDWASAITPCAPTNYPTSSRCIGSRCRYFWIEHNNDLVASVSGIRTTELDRRNQCDDVRGDA